MEVEKRTKDPVAQTILKIAEEKGLSTAFQRAEEVKPCPIGSEGLCCKLCGMGPCRLVGKTEVGVCGATRATVAARNFARMVAAGAAAHSDHGRDLAFTLIAVAKGEAQGYRIRDVRKLYEVAKLMGVPTQGREVNDITLEVGEKALAEFGRQEGELLYVQRAPRKRQQIWQDLKIYPRGVDREIVEIMHRTHTGVDMDAENILNQAMRCALADGWGGSMLATDLSDILFGTPSPLLADINLSVLKEDEVNVVIHGHEPTLSEMIVAAAGDPELIEYAKSKGAKGINLAGICCTANEVLMRHGIPPAGNYLHQELAIITGAVDAMVVDVQCIMQGLARLAEEFHTVLITTSPKAKIPGATHIEFDEHHAYDIAKEIIRMGIDNFPNRGATMIPDSEMGNHLVAGFSHEYIGYMQGGLYRGSFRPLNDAIAQGRIRGVAGVVGCNNARVCQDEGITSIIDRFIAQDVLVVVTGCAGHGAGKYGYLTPERMAKAGKGLREVCEAIGVPPVLHMGSCVDNSRILTVLSQMATEGGLGEDIADLPAVGICPEWMSEKAISIGVYCVASGAYVLFGVHSPVAGCEEVTKLISEGWETKVGGKLEFEPDIDKIVEKALAHIDKKREALGLEKYNPERYGQSGDWRMEAVEAAIARGEEVNLRSFKELVKA
ncbi:MAG: anaerobic carbon-monoxide dehydrogenase catalytic subunit [Chloroflexi bacterium]|nr:anaerobic carbon-monoxide dehydrogenase catalytic subunit [Chloroflexota bacterium]